MIPHHYSSSSRLQFRSIYRAAIVLIPLLLLLSSCHTTTRIETMQRTLTDTMHLSITDTTHHVFSHDTTIVTHREYITEHIIARYDRETGNMTEQEITRSIIRRADSIAAQRLDSLMRVNHLTAEHSRSDTTSIAREEVIKPASDTPLSFWKRLVFSSVGMLLFVIGGVWISVKLYLRG